LSAGFATGLAAGFTAGAGFLAVMRFLDDA
jgi:hypothetical protein